MKFEVRKTDYNEYDVRLSDRTKEKIKKFFIRSYWTALFAATAFIYTILKLDQKSK